MSHRISGRRNLTATAVLIAGLALAAVVTGCSRQSSPPRASVGSCVQFGVAAVRDHVTVTALPPECQGLTGTQINFAIGSALHSAAIGAEGKVAQRARIAEASHYLDHLVVTVPAQLGHPVFAAPAAGVSRMALGVAALCGWLLTIALGLRMMARWFLRGRGSRGQAGRPRRAPVLNLAHLGLAVVGLLAWIGYLASGVTGLAWAGCALLVLATGLGMALAFIPHQAAPRGEAPAQPALAATGGRVPAGDRALATDQVGTGDRGQAATVAAPRRRRPPVVTLGAHVTLATVTILLAFLTAIGVG